MQKIPTMFVRDETRRGHPVTDQVTPGCEWVLAGEGVATAKLDGTNLKVDGGQLFKRQKPTAREYDTASYVACVRDDPADRWAYEGFDACAGIEDGIYELIGPKVQGNPHQFQGHVLVRVVPPSALVSLAVQPQRTFDGLRAYLGGAADVVSDFEGVVFHHPDGRLAKIKRRDFGLPWPPS